jgi:2'-5' RNA ligase
MMNIAGLACFNSELEKDIKNIWKEFELNGIGKTPGQYGEDPHISMFVISNQSENKVIDLLKVVSNQKMEVKLIPYGIFNGKEKVIYLNVVESDDIHNLKNKYYSILDRNEICIDKHYKMNESILHCTIAVNILDSDFTNAIEIMGKLKPEYSGNIDRIQIIEYFPITKVFEKSLL